MDAGRLLVGVVLLSCAATMAPACSSSDSTPPGESDDAGAEAAPPPSQPDTGVGDETSPTPTGECSADSDCTPKLPVTTPEGCAVATCDTLQKKCHFVARDADGDGHRAKSCSAATGTIETGDDCDDNDAQTYPGAWDGPPTDFDSGAGVEPDRCDTKDNDCNGSPDDGKLSVDGGTKTCKCDPNKPLACYEYPNGAPIDPGTLDANNNPKGACKKGSRTCTNGIPGTCVGAVGPQVEQCDDLDHDCNGKTGNQGDLVPSAPIWYKDADNDNFGDMNVAPKQQCKAPDATWKQSIPNTDCNDGDPAINPGHAEVCDNKDNNCNGVIDENVKTHYCQDGDSDAYCTTTCIDQCPPPPGGYIPAIQCLAGTDCNDANNAVHPGATEVCNGVDDNCNGSIDEGVTTKYCVDADNDAYCLASCVDACAPPNATYRTASSCVGGVDCVDNNPNINPGQTELCNGVDDNCNNAVDEGFNIGTACIAGTFGVCKRNGTIRCASTSTTTCSPGAGTPVNSLQSSASTDPYIYKGSDTTSYTAAWDWNCDNTIETNFTYVTGVVAGELCNAVTSGDLTATCQAAGNAGLCGKTLIYPCSESCGALFCTPAQACGHTGTIGLCLADCTPAGITSTATVTCE